jgi:hypothetical protein
MVDGLVDYSFTSPARTRATTLGKLAAANDLEGMNKLLGPLDVNTIVLDSVNLPRSVLRRPEHCPLLDVAVGAGAVEVTKNLLEFHRAKPTRETLKMALSVGDVALIRLIWERLPALDHEGRLDLLEVAADFHREEPLEWLLKEATELEKEAFAVFALEQHLADALLVALSNGVKPWSWRSRELVVGWPVAAGLEFGVPPEGLSVNVGWWLHMDGRLSEIVPVEGEWTPTFNAQGCVEVTLPFGATGLGASAFANCPGLRRITLSPTMTMIGTQALLRCSGLCQLTIPNGVKTIGEAAFGGLSGVSTLALPTTVTSIGELALKACTRLRSLVMPPTLTKVDERLCEGCLGITEVTLPSGLRSIDDAAFHACARLTAVNIPLGVVRIGHCAFLACAGLKTVTVPRGVVEIGAGAFAHCAGLVRLELPFGVVTIGSAAFEGCSSLVDIEVPQGVTRIMEKTFAGCSALVDLVVPRGVTVVDEWAFKGCISLVRLVFPESVASIGEFALMGCTSLTRLTFPAEIPDVPFLCFSGLLLELELVGTMVTPAVVEALVGYISASSRVFGAQLAGRSFGPFPIYET